MGGLHLNKWIFALEAWRKLQGQEGTRSTPARR
jgi:hypothetical protein